MLGPHLEASRLSSVSSASWNSSSLPTEGEAAVGLGAPPPGALSTARDDGDLNPPDRFAVSGE